MGARYDLDRAGLGRLLRSPGMQAEMRRRAELVAARARALAPVETGEYRASIRVESGIRPADGPRAARAVGRVIAGVPHALLVEFGTEKRPGSRVLGRALDAAGD